jgi:hypothetical protein
MAARARVRSRSQTWRMEALVGFAGVIAGVLVTGGVQWISGAAERRLASRSSARQLTVLALRAHAAALALVERKDWRETDPDWEVFTVRWDEHSPHLARTVGVNDFIVLAHFFQMVDKIGVVRTRQLAEDIVAVCAQQLRGCQHVVDLGVRVSDILLTASQTRKEKAGDLPNIPDLPPELLGDDN